MSEMRRTKNPGILAKSIKMRMEGRGAAIGIPPCPSVEMPELKPLDPGETFMSSDPNAYLLMPEEVLVEEAEEMFDDTVGNIKENLKFAHLNNRKIAIFMKVEQTGKNRKSLLIHLYNQRRVLKK